MPLVRCPDCLREITLSQDDLTRVIECSACAARFGPLLVTPAPPPPPGDWMPEERPTSGDSDTDRPDKAVRPKRFKPKPRTRVVPVLAGTFIGLGATAALLVAIWLVMHANASSSGHSGGSTEKAPATTPRTAR
jgi:hypothetical protein